MILASICTRIATCAPLIGGGFYVANEWAWKSNTPFKMAAVIIKGGSVLSVGYNHILEHPAAYFGGSFHAEHHALRLAPPLKGAKMYVYRFSRRDNTLRPSKPCIYCQQLIRDSGISSCVFIDEEENLRKASFKNCKNTSNHRRHIFFGTTDCYTQEHFGSHA